MRPDSQNKSNRVVILAMLALAIALFAAIPIASANGVAFQVKGEIEDVLGPPPNNPCTGEAMEAYGDAVLFIYETGAGYALHINGAGATMVGVDSGTFYFG